MEPERYTLISIRNESDKFIFSTKNHQTGTFETKVDAFVTIIDLLYENLIFPNEAAKLAYEVLEHSILKSSEMKIKGIDGIVESPTKDSNEDLYQDDDSDYFNKVFDACEIRQIYDHIESFPVFCTYLEFQTNPHAIIVVERPIFRKSGNEFDIIISSSIKFYCKEQGWIVVECLYEESQINLLQKEELLDKLEKLHIPEFPLEQMN
jgi:hypothetical protein